MHSGKKPQSSLVKSDDFENSFPLPPFYIFFLNPVYVAARSLRSLRSNNEKSEVFDRFETLYNTVVSVR